ncbi:MAG: hypothetical protein IT310_15315 [Anaerolineales bacterium]|nr:hypothetical protein [Anaerolineales bacterium]
MNDYIRLPYAEQLRRNIKTVKRWKGKKPESILYGLIEGLQRLTEKYSFKHG